MEIKDIKISELKEYELNAKIHDASQIKNVAQSIKQFGFVQPLVIDADGVIVIGHCRFAAAKKLKLKTVPCVIVDELTDEEIRKLRIADNKTNESAWDFDLLAEDIADLDFSDFDFGFDYDEKEPSFEEIDGGELKDNEDKQVEVKIHFQNVYSWRLHEKELRELIDTFEGANIIVGDVYEN